MSQVGPKSVSPSRDAEPGGNEGICLPFFLNEKSALFLGQSAPFKERKKYLLNEHLLLLERMCPFCSSKDSVKAIFDVIVTCDQAFLG